MKIGQGELAVWGSQLQRWAWFLNSRGNCLAGIHKDHPDQEVAERVVEQHEKEGYLKNVDKDEYL